MKIDLKLEKFLKPERERALKAIDEHRTALLDMLDGRDLRPNYDIFTSHVAAMIRAQQCADLLGGYEVKFPPFGDGGDQ